MILGRRKAIDFLKVHIYKRYITFLYRFKIGVVGLTCG